MNDIKVDCVVFDVEYDRIPAFFSTPENWSHYMSIFARWNALVHVCRSLNIDYIWYGSGFQARVTGSGVYRSPYWDGSIVLPKYHSPWLYRPQRPDVHERTLAATAAMNIPMCPFVWVFGGYVGNTWKFKSNRHYQADGTENAPEFNYHPNLTKKTGELLKQFGVETIVAGGSPAIKKGVRLNWQQHFETLLQAWGY